MTLQLPSRDPQPLPPGLYATDAFHRHPLLMVDGEVVRSWNEAHALHGPARLSDVNPVYVAALISGNYNAEAAPYARIRRLPRAHYVRIGPGGMEDCHAYEPLAGGAVSMEPEALHQFLRQGLLDQVQQDLLGHEGDIGCEHSSGLDSNAILGALVHGLEIDPKRIHTWSNEKGGEGPPLQAFRPFYRLEPTQCHRSEAENEPGQAREIQLKQDLAVIGAPGQIGANHQAIKKLRQQGCTLIFSGFGGDQAISHNAQNVPTDLVAERRWNELDNWMGGRYTTIKTVISRGMALYSRQWAIKRVLRHSREFCTSKVLIQNLTSEGRKWIGPYIKTLYPWEIDSYLRLHQSIEKRVMADWVTLRVEEESRLAEFHGVNKAFPLLNEKLIGSLLNQDPILFGECAGKGRLLHRMAFKPFLHPYLQKNPSKEREPDEGYDKMIEELSDRCQKSISKILETTKDWHPEIKKKWDLNAIQNEAEELALKNRSTVKDIIGLNKAMTTMANLNDWWNNL